MSKAAKEYRNITVKVTKETMNEIRARAVTEGTSVPGVLMTALERTYGIKDGIGRHYRTVDGDEELREEPVDAPPTIYNKRHPYSHEAQEYWCPVCKNRLEETERRDVTDMYGDTRYHSCELQLECTHCSNGAGIVLSFPYID